MDLQFSPQQELLRSNLRAYLARHYGFVARRAAVSSAPGWQPSTWAFMCRDLGLVGAALHGQTEGEGGAVETMIVMEELGGALVVEPYLESAVVGGNLLARSHQAKAQAAFARLLEGRAVLSLAWRESGAGWDAQDIKTTAAREGGGEWKLDGRKTSVSVAPWCTDLIVVARTSDGTPGLFLLDVGTPGARLVPYATIDGRWAADVILEDVCLPADARIDHAGDAAALLEWISDLATAALCAEAVGMMRAMLQQTLAYARLRQQFGKPIAEFQVIQHRLVDMRIQLELAASASLLATLSLDESPQRRRMATAAAKVSINQACRFVGQSAIQLHGGIGMTEECPISHYFRRCTALEIELGGTDWHLARHAMAERLISAAGEAA